jgi:serine/threonine protein kinase
MGDRSGQQLGNYRLVRLLGRGSFAQVYLGEHLHLQTQVAMKLLHAQLGSAEQQDFLREARTIARLRHPHIVRVLEFGVEEETPYLVMEYASRGTLRARYPKRSQIAPEVILPYVQQVAEALDYAHQQHLIHRDVKPENVLLGARGQALLSDFGIAVLTQSVQLRRTGEAGIAGTLPYMAPEQLRGQPCPASDQYSLAIVAYEWLTGERPFRGAFAEVAAQQMLAAPPPLRDKVPTLAPAVEAVIVKALAKDAKDRFDTVGAFAAALEQAIHALLAPPLTPKAPPMVAARLPGPLAELPAAQARLQEVSSALPDLHTSRTLESEPGLSVDESKRSPRRLSRRAVLAAGGAGVVLGLGGVLAWLAHRPSPTGSRQQATTPSRTTPSTGAVKGLRVLSELRNPWLFAWSPDGKRLAVGFFPADRPEGRIGVWDFTTGGLALTYPLTGSWGEWSPKGEFIVLDATVCRADTGDPLFTYQGAQGAAIDAVHWSPDGTRLAFGLGDHTVLIWDLQSGATLFTYAGHSSAIADLAWSHDGGRILSCDGAGSVKVWEALTGTTFFSFQAGQPGATVAWSSDGKRFAFLDLNRDPDRDQIRIFDASSGTHTGAVAASGYAFAWSRQHDHLALLNRDSTIEIYDVSGSQGRLLMSLSSERSAPPLVWSPDGTRLASASLASDNTEGTVHTEGTVLIWSIGA